MRKLRYLARINKDPDSDWGASVPDLPGCVATGKTIDATLRRIQVAIELHLRGMHADGRQPPRPRSVVPRQTSRQVDFYATVEVAARVSTDRSASPASAGSCQERLLANSS